jgi:hypothetical protein
VGRFWFYAVKALLKGKEEVKERCREEYLHVCEVQSQHFSLFMAVNNKTLMQSYFNN